LNYKPYFLRNPRNKLSQINLFKKRKKFNKQKEKAKFKAGVILPTIHHLFSFDLSDFA